MVLLLYCAVGYVNVSDVNLSDLKTADRVSHCSFLRNKLTPALSWLSSWHFWLEFQGPRPHWVTQFRLITGVSLLDPQLSLLL